MEGFDMMARLSVIAGQVEGLLKLARITVTGEPVGTNDLRQVAERTVASAVPGRREEARRLALLAFRSLVEDLLAVELALETHSAKSAITTRLESFAHALTGSSLNPFLVALERYEVALTTPVRVSVPPLCDACLVQDLISVTDRQSGLCEACRVTGFVEKGMAR